MSSVNPNSNDLRDREQDPFDDDFDLDLDSLIDDNEDDFDLDSLIDESSSISQSSNSLETSQQKGQNFKTFSFETVTVDSSGNIVKRETKSANYITLDLGNGVTMDLVYIPAGTFMMGSPDAEIQRLNQKFNSDWFNKEAPQHRVTIQPFYMGKYQVTQAQWQAIMGNNPSNFKGDNHPVEQVSWEQCQEFCQKLSAKINQEVCLPSEAQWEYACRAGTTTPFYFGETITTDLANYNGNYTFANESKGTYRGGTTPVGSFPPNAFGLYDMHGNVWEWCQDT